MTDGPKGAQPEETPALNPPTWEELEVRKRTLNFGTAGVLDAPDFDLAPTAEGKATIRWKVSGRKETPLKDGTVEITTILAITKVDIDLKSIVVPFPDPKLPGMDGKSSGQMTTAGAAVDEVIAAIEAGAEVPPHAFSEPASLEDDDPNGDPACVACGLVKSWKVHSIDVPPDQVAKKRAAKSGTMKATRPPRARG